MLEINKLPKFLVDELNNQYGEEVCNQIDSLINDDKDKDEDVDKEIN